MKRLLLLLTAALFSSQVLACPVAEALIKRYGISFSGFEVALPSTTEPVKNDAFFSVDLPDVEQVLDGFGHTAYVDSATHRAWILRTGGFVPRRQWYGPVDIGNVSLTGCRPETRIESANLQVPPLR